MPFHPHLPKPLHGWREFLGEVGVIVIGVLIALAAEQGVEALRDRHVAEQTRRDVRAEAAINLQFADLRAREADCVDRRIAELTRIVQSGSVPANLNWVGQPSNYPAYFERWRASTSTARTALFPPGEQEALDNFYAVTSLFQGVEAREQDAWSELSALARWRGRLTPEMQLSLLQALQTAQKGNYAVRNYGVHIDQPARRIGLKPNPHYGDPGRVPATCIPTATPLARVAAIRGGEAGESPGNSANAL